MLLGHLALFAISQGAPPGHVTYVNAGARLELLLPALSNACGIELKPDRKMLDVVLILRLDAAPTSEVLAKVAYAARGTWVRRGSRLVLYSDAAGIARDEAKRAAEYRTHMCRMLASATAALDPRAPGTAEEDS